MISVRVDLHGIEETVTRPVLITVANDVKELMGMGKDIYTVFDEKDNVIKNKNKSGEIVGDNTLKDEMISIDYTESSEDNHELHLAVVSPDFKPIYIDKDVKCKITPVYLTRRMNVKIKYSCKSKSKVFSIANKLKLNTSSDDIYKQHDLEYHYVIPNFILQLLAHINRLKGSIPSYKIGLDEYLAKTFDDRADFTNTLDGDINKSRLVIREKQLMIEGYISDDVHGITPEYDDDLGNWYIEFEYQLSYEKPVTLLTQYQIMIFNQVIDKPFRHFLTQPSKRTNPEKNTARQSDMNKITARDDTFNIRDGGYYITIPEIDTFILPKSSTKHSRMFSVMIQIEEYDRTYLFNVAELPDIKFRDGVFKFLIESERDHIGEIYQSLFYVELYKDDKKDYNNIITMDQFGILRSTYELEYKHTYRVVFNVQNDLTYLSQEGIKRFKNFVTKQLNENNIKTSVTFQESYQYWSGLRYDKYNLEVTKDNLVTDYLTLMRYDSKSVNTAIKGSDNVYDIPFKIKYIKSKSLMKTVAAHSTITAFMESKKTVRPKLEVESKKDEAKTEKI